MASVLSVASGVEDIFAHKTFDWLGGLLQGFAAEITGGVRDRICRRNGKIIFQDSSIECRDVMATFITKF